MQFFKKYWSPVNAFPFSFLSYPKFPWEKKWTCHLFQAIFIWIGFSWATSRTYSIAMVYQTEGRLPLHFLASMLNGRTVLGWKYCHSTLTHYLNNPRSLVELSTLSKQRSISDVCLGCPYSSTLLLNTNFLLWTLSLAIRISYSCSQEK